jgi:hypothetical protein
MLATCENGGVGLTIAHERGEWGWQSLMREGNGDGDKSISDGEQEQLQWEWQGRRYFAKRSPSFWLYIYNYYYFKKFMPTGSLSKNQVAIGRFLATKKKHWLVGNAKCKSAGHLGYLGGRLLRRLRLRRKWPPKKKKSKVSSQKRTHPMKKHWPCHPTDGQNDQMVHWWVLAHSGPFCAVKFNSDANLCRRMGEVWIAYEKLLTLRNRPWKHLLHVMEQQLAHSSRLMMLLSGMGPTKIHNNPSSEIRP